MRPRLISLQMLDDPEGAYLGKYDKFLPQPDKEPKAPKEPKETKERGWSKADRDRAIKMTASLGVSDVARLAREMGKSVDEVRTFVDGLLTRLVDAVATPPLAKAASDILPEACLLYTSPSPRDS